MAIVQELCKKCEIGQYVVERTAPAGVDNPKIYLAFNNPTMDCMLASRYYIKYNPFVLAIAEVSPLIRVNYCVRCPATKVVTNKWKGQQVVRREPSKEEFDNCKEFFFDDIEKTKPSLIVFDSPMIFQKLTGVAEASYFKYKIFKHTIRGKEYPILLTDYIDEIQEKTETVDTVKKVMKDYFSDKADILEVHNNQFTYHFIKNSQDYENYINTFKGGEIAYDLETTNFQYVPGSEVIGFSLSKKIDEGCYCVFDSLDYKMDLLEKKKIEGRMTEELKKNATYPIVHNSLFELPFTVKWLGYEIPYDRIEDTIVFMKTLFIGRFRYFNLKSAGAIVGVSNWSDDVQDYMTHLNIIIKNLWEVRNKPTAEYTMVYSDGGTLRDLYSYMKRKVLKEKGSTKKQLSLYNALDGLIAMLLRAYSLDELDHLLMLIKNKIQINIHQKSSVNMSYIPYKILSTYGANDSIVTFKLFKELKRKYKEHWTAYREAMRQYFWGYRLNMTGAFLDYDFYFKAEEQILDRTYEIYHILIDNENFQNVLRGLIQTEMWKKKKSKKGSADIKLDDIPIADVEIEIQKIQDNVVALSNSSDIVYKRLNLEKCFNGFFNFKSPLNGKYLLEYFAWLSKIVKVKVKGANEEILIELYKEYVKRYSEDPNFDFEQEKVDNDPIFQLLFYFRCIKKLSHFLSAYIWKFIVYFRTVKNSEIEANIPFLTRHHLDIMKDPAPPDKRILIQTNFNPLQTDTGRWTASNPPIHNLPWHSIIKQLFISRYTGGIIASPDFSQMEVRAMAAIAGDETLIKNFQDPTFDFHMNTAMGVYNLPREKITETMRRYCKMATFRILYGSSAEGFAKEFLEGNVKEAEKIINGFWNTYTQVKLWAEDTVEKALKGIPVRMITGRLVTINSFSDEEKKRQAVNYVIQGSASDVAGQCGYYIDEEFHNANMFSKAFSFVHDALYIDMHPKEIYNSIEIVSRVLDDVPINKFQFPAKVDLVIGANMGEEVTVKKFEKGGNNQTILSLKGREDHVNNLFNKLSEGSNCTLTDTEKVGEEKIRLNEIFVIKKPLNMYAGSTFNEIKTTLTVEA